VTTTPKTVKCAYCSTLFQSPDAGTVYAVAIACPACWKAASDEADKRAKTVKTKPAKTSRGTLRRGSNTIVACTTCGRRFQSHTSDGAGPFRPAESILCPACWEAAGMENEHSDGHHRDQPNGACEACRNEATIGHVKRISAELASRVKSIGALVTKTDAKTTETPKTSTPVTTVKEVSMRASKSVSVSKSKTVSAKKSKPVATKPAAKKSAAKKSVKPASAKRDARLPAPGTIIKSGYKGKDITATVRANGIEWKGKLYRSVSAVAGKIAGHKYNGFAFFGLLKK
jgi:hypothetical protein